MKSGKAGKHISQVEILNISKFGFWILIEGREHFLAFEHFPWFKEAKISEIMNAELHRNHHLFWPSLDIDLEIESIRHPEKYPLVYNAS